MKKSPSLQDLALLDTVLHGTGKLTFLIKFIRNKLHMAIPIQMEITVMTERVNL
jgi:hypothetical protein